MDELEISGELKNESAVFTKSGQTIGQATSTTDTTTNNSSGDLYKSENTARFFINGDVGEEGSSFHAELNLKYDTEATDGYKGAKSYSQHDLLRELYVDTEVGNEDNPISIRAGKQQVVWGTADGIKLLDIINPTDWREMAQNSMEDSRIPVWMLNAEMDLESGGNVQVVLSQAEENKIAGMTTANGATRAVPFTWGNPSSTTNTTQLKGTDSGHTYMMKGADTISGGVNGFLNIGAAMGAVTAQFSGDGVAYRDANGTVTQGNVSNMTASKYSFINPGAELGNDGTTQVGTTGNYFNPEFNTVGTFTAGTNMPAECSTSNLNGAACLKFMTENANENVTNLTNADILTGAGWDTSNPDSMWEYMDNATFATFNAFVNMTTKYERNHPSDSSTNLGSRYKGSLDNGLNYSFNYLYNYDPNPVVQLHWEDPDTGEKLEVVTVDNGAGAKVIQLKNSANVFYGVNADFSTDINTAGATDVTTGAKPAQLVFEETLERVHNLGISLDHSIETDISPVVLRGEFLYQKDVMTPVLDRNKLSDGDLTGALKMEKGDYFKYVLGADLTVMTNLMLSGQFIQMRNLDYIDSGVAESGVACSATNCGRYTADQSVMHLSNNLQKAEENKEFYSFFMSKPFGAEQQHRWNNIFMFEENGGKWNRADVEYSFSDEIIGSAEYNKYWGDENTQFGQLEKSSNFQLGLKYIF